MTIFRGTDGNDIANSALGILGGFTVGTVADLTDGVGDSIMGGDGADFVFAGSANDHIEGGAGFDFLNGAEGDDVIYANTSADQSGIGDELVGNLGDDQLHGSSGADSLFGSDGDDSLIGYLGADVLDGGNGNDALVFFAGDVGAGETIDGGAGVDTIVAVGGASFLAAASIDGIERVVIDIGSSATFSAHQVKHDFGTVVAVVPLIPERLRIEMGAETSFTAIFAFEGWGAEDSIDIIGDGNSETITGGFVHERIFGNGGNDVLTGGDGADVLSGGAGNDVLNGGRADDTLIGGDGLDTISWSGDEVAIVFTLPESGEGLGPGLDGFGPGQDNFISIENVTGGLVSDRITGNSGANTLNGLAGNDTLTGGAGGDTLIGGVGTGDTLSYAGSNAGVTVNIGTNTASGGHAAGDTISGFENVVGSGQADTLIGNTLANTLNGGAGNDTLIGQDGNDILTGGTGVDAMTGGTGNDKYFVDNALDNVTEAAGGGSDQVLASVSYVLTAASAVELLTTANAAGTGAVNLTGNALVQTVQGNNGNNILNGGLGSDTLRGFNGSDSFAFTTALGAANIDTVADFNVAADTIRLENAIFNAILGTGTLTLAQFVANTSGIAADSSDRIIYETDTGKLFYDSNGNGAGGAVQFAKLTSGLALTNADFFVI